MSLKDKLIKAGKTRWLDIGCNKNFEKNFYFLDVFPKKEIPRKYRKKYFKINILRLSKAQSKRLGKFDLVRMQHVLEHFSHEEGSILIKNISKILKRGGFILITAPDLKINVEKYLNNNYRYWKAFNWWAFKRIPKNSPASFYFSVFAYSLPITPHKWCYDYQGIKYLLKSSGLFKNIKKLELYNQLSNVPFTHNRPEEDVCVIANRA